METGKSQWDLKEIFGALWKKTVRMTETVRNIRLMLLIPNRQNPLAVYSNKRTDRALYMRRKVLSFFF